MKNEPEQTNVFKNLAENLLDVNGTLFGIIKTHQADTYNEFEKPDTKMSVGGIERINWNIGELKYFFTLSLFRQDKSAIVVIKKISANFFKIITRDFKYFKRSYPLGCENRTMVTQSLTFSEYAEFLQVSVFISKNESGFEICDENKICELEELFGNLLSLEPTEQFLKLLETDEQYKKRIADESAALYNNTVENEQF